MVVRACRGSIAVCNVGQHCAVLQSRSVSLGLICLGHRPIWPLCQCQFLSLCQCLFSLTTVAFCCLKGTVWKDGGLLKMYHRQNTRHSMVCPNQIGSGFQRVYHVIIFSEKHTGHNNPCYQACCECTVANSLHLHFDNLLKIGSLQNFILSLFRLSIFL